MKHEYILLFFMLIVICNNVFGMKNIVSVSLWFTFWLSKFCFQGYYRSCSFVEKITVVLKERMCKAYYLISPFCLHALKLSA